MHGPLQKNTIDLSTASLILKAEIITDPTLKKLQEKAESLRFTEAKREIESLTLMDQNFDIRKYRLSQTHCFEIANLMIQALVHTDEFRIQNFSLNQDQQFKIALQIVNKIKDIKNFPIHLYSLSGDNQFTLCKRIIEKNPFITDEEIEQMAPKEALYYTSLTGFTQFLSEFAEKQRYELAKKSLSESKSPSKDFSIKSFNINNKDFLFHLANSAINIDPDYIQHVIEHKIDEQNRIEMAKKIAQINGETISKHIQSLQISDENELFLIALSAFNNTKGATRYIPNYGFSNDSFLKTLFILSKEKLKASTESPPKESSNNKYEGKSLAQLEKLLRKYLDTLTSIRILANNKGATEGEQKNAKTLMNDLEEKVKKIEQEMRKKRRNQ
jgi:hypothetical protein